MELKIKNGQGMYFDRYEYVIENNQFSFIHAEGFLFPTTTANGVIDLTNFTYSFSQKEYVGITKDRFNFENIKTREKFSRYITKEHVNILKEFLDDYFSNIRLKAEEQKNAPTQSTHIVESKKGSDNKNKTLSKKNKKIMSQTWEYTRVNSFEPTSSDYLDKYNKLGEEGWELVCQYNCKEEITGLPKTVALFKRMK